MQLSASKPTYQQWENALKAHCRAIGYSTESIRIIVDDQIRWFREWQAGMTPAELMADIERCGLAFGKDYQLDANDPELRAA